MQALQGIDLGDGQPPRAHNESPLWDVVHQEDDFTHKKIIAQLLAPPRADTANGPNSAPVNRFQTLIMANSVWLFPCFRVCMLP